MSVINQANAKVEPVVVKAGEGRRIEAGAWEMFVIEDGSHTSGTHAVLEFVLDGQFSPPPHIHHQHEEVIYVLEGEIALHLGDEKVLLGPGSAFVTPIGLQHTFSNAGTGRLRFLLTISPARHLAFFEAMAELLRQSPPDPQTMMGVMREYGLEPIRAA